MNSQSLRFICIVFSLFFLGCPKDKPKDIIIPPEPTNCEYPPGNRNFMWRLDTVAWWPSWLGGVWAFSDTDAYLMGYIKEGKPPWDLFMAKHWNGKEWNTDVHGTYEDIKHYANDVTGDSFFMVSVGYWAIGAEKAALAEFDNRTKQWKGIQFETQGELRSVWTDGNGYFIAVGDNGMVYTKDGYSANWVYQKAPTEFNFYRVTGVSKNEIYLSGTSYSFDIYDFYKQGWKIENGVWEKLYDTQDTTNTILHLTISDDPNEIGVWRCAITDSLKMYVVGRESYLFESKGQELHFQKTNLTDLGLPLAVNGRTATRVFVFSPNDVWITATRYNFYHWNGKNFARMTAGNLPTDNSAAGYVRGLIKTQSGKLFFASDVPSSGQIFIVVQMNPL